MMERGGKMQRRAAPPKGQIIEQGMRTHPGPARTRIWEKSKPEEEMVEAWPKRRIMGEMSETEALRRRRKMQQDKAEPDVTMQQLEDKRCESSGAARPGKRGCDEAQPLRETKHKTAGPEDANEAQERTKPRGNEARASTCDKSSREEGRGKREETGNETIPKRQPGSPTRTK